VWNAKRTVLLVVIGLLTLTLMSAAGFTAKAPANLTVCMPNWGASTDPGLQEAVKDYMEKQTKTSIKMLAIPMNAYSDKINVLLASGDIPDVYRVTKAMVNVQAYTNRGYTAELDKYVRKVKEFRKIDRKYFNYMRVNGKIHAIPMGKESEKVLWTRKDILDKYGVKLSSTPTTEEFYNEMKKVKDIIPLSFPKFMDNMPFFYSTFGAYDEFIKNKRGKYYDAFNSPEMKECLKYVNRLYKEGILDKEFPTCDNTTLRNNLISGKAAVNLDYDNRYFYYYGEITRLTPNIKPDLHPLFRLTGPKGLGGTLNEAVQDAYAVSPKSKAPQAATDLIAWMYYTPDGLKAVRIGLPGKHYTIEGNNAKLTPQAESGGMTLDLTQVMKMFVDVDQLNFGFKFPNEDMNSTYLKLTKDISKYSGPKHVVPAGASPTYDRVGPSLVKKRQELALKMILGTSSIEEGFKEYEAFFKSINGDQIIKELNTKKK
jgi:putative aldouronate transport system substrate-binding protein